MAKGDRPPAILQRDGETFAVVVDVPAGLTNPEQLRRIAEVAEKYRVAAIKLTGAQRIALVGLKEDQLETIWQDLGMDPAHAIGLCVRSVKVCPGTTFCKRGMQDSVGVGLKLHGKYFGIQMPCKMKMAVSGCPMHCSDAPVRDIGLAGRKAGWTLYVGGCVGPAPRIGDVLAEGLSDEEGLALVDRIVNYVVDKGLRMRLGRHLEQIGLEAFREAVLGQEAASPGD